MSIIERDYQALLERNRNIQDLPEWAVDYLENGCSHLNDTSCKSVDELTIWAKYKHGFIERKYFPIVRTLLSYQLIHNPIRIDTRYTYPTKYLYGPEVIITMFAEGMLWEDSYEYCELILRKVISLELDSYENGNVELSWHFMKNVYYWSKNNEWHELSALIRTRPEFNKEQLLDYCDLALIIKSGDYESFINWSMWDNCHDQDMRNTALMDILERVYDRGGLYIDGGFIREDSGYSYGLFPVDPRFVVWYIETGEYNMILIDLIDFILDAEFRMRILFKATCGTYDYPEGSDDDSSESNEINYPNRFIVDDQPVSSYLLPNREEVKAYLIEYYDEEFIDYCLMNERPEFVIKFAKYYSTKQMANLLSKTYGYYPKISMDCRPDLIKALKARIKFKMKYFYTYSETLQQQMIASGCCLSDIPLDIREMICQKIFPSVSIDEIIGMYEKYDYDPEIRSALI